MLTISICSEFQVFYQGENGLPQIRVTERYREVEPTCVSGAGVCGVFKEPRV
jgi:hypothetical protein